MMNNDYAQVFLNSVHQQPTKPSHTPFLKKWLGLIIGVTAIIVVLIAAAIILPILSKDEAEPEDLVKEEGDITAIAETLNPEYRKAIASSPHTDYEADRSYDTGFSGFTVQQVCKHIQVNCNKLATPEKIYGFRKIRPINSNSLDYYLDQNYLVVMKAVYKDSDPSTPYPFVIYARTGGLYYVFDPNSEYQIYMTKAELFSDIIGVPDFYLYGVDK